MEKKQFTHNNRGLVYTYVNNNQKQTIVFLHGAGSNLDQFQNMVPAFKSQFNVLNITLFAHDEQFKNDHFSNDMFELYKLKEDVIQLFQTLNLNDLVLVGNSVGGLVAIDVMASHKFNVQLLVTFGTTLKLDYPLHVVNLISKIDHFMLRHFKDYYLKLMVNASTKNKNTAHQMFTIMKKSAHVAPYIRSQIGKYDKLDIVKNMQVPYLILLGKHDKSINKSMEKIIKNLPSNKLVYVKLVEDAGHFMNLDNPAVLYHQIMEHYEMLYNQ